MGRWSARSDSNRRKAGLQPTPLATQARAHGFAVERVTGVEPASSGWKPEALPLSYTRMAAREGVEPSTVSLTGSCSAIELPGIGGGGGIRTPVHRIKSPTL